MGGEGGRGGRGQKIFLASQLISGQSVRSSVNECMTAPFGKSSIRLDRLAS